MASADRELELSVVIPCLNEADTVATCVAKAKKAIDEHGIRGEVVVADNGSTDGSQRLAIAAGARVVAAAERGYGSALMAGIAASRGTYLVMGDADDSYDFGELPSLLAELRKGVDLVQGCRLPAGGGTIHTDAMPWSHRWIGNPGFSFLARWWFKAPIHDAYCGLRGFSRAHYERLDQRCTGMEFAVEMILKSSLLGARISEVPITLHKDGRIVHPPHVRTFRDGWRTLRFFLTLSPKWLFLVPGLAAMFLGLLAFAVALPGVTIGTWTADAHTLVFGAVAVLCGWQSLMFAILSTTFAVNERLIPASRSYVAFYRYANLERGILLSLVSLAAGVCLLSVAVYRWMSSGLGHMDYSSTMRIVVPGAVLTVLGVQTLLSSFFVSMLGLQRDKGRPA